MRLRTPACLFVGLSVLLASGNAMSQGIFQNLDFEHPITPLTPVNFQVPTSDGMPEWTAYTYGNPQSTIVYNTLSLGAAAVSLQGPGSLEPILQGGYTVILQGASGGTPGGAAIGQIGQIPLTARSLVFWGYVGLDNVSFDGQALPLIQTGNTAHYNIYGADISTFAGQSGELLFTAPPTYMDLVDNIQFSDQPVPEPSVLGLSVLGALLAGWRVVRRRQ
jgi:hypothetical protein